MITRFPKFKFKLVLNRHCINCLAEILQHNIFARAPFFMHDRRPWTELSCMLKSLIMPLHLRGVHVTDDTSHFNMTPQGPGSRLQDWDIPSSPLPSLPSSLPHTPPPAPPPSLWTSTKYQRTLIRVENRRSTPVIHAKRDYFCSRHTKCGLSEILSLPLLLLLLLSPAEEPIKGSPPQHSNVRHHPSLSLCSPSISLGRLAVAADSSIDSSLLFLFLAWSCLSPPSTILLAAFPFQKRHLLSSSAHESEAVPRRRWLLSRRLPHSSPALEICDTILRQWKDSLALVTGSYLQPVKRPHLNSVCWSPPYYQQTATLFPLVCRK